MLLCLRRNSPRGAGGRGGAGELASLAPLHFALASDPPTVRVEAAYTKNGEEATQPLPPDVAELLRGYLTGRPPDQPVWPGTWHEKAARMLRADLAAAFDRRSS